MKEKNGVRLRVGVGARANKRKVWEQRQKIQLEEAPARPLQRVEERAGWDEWGVDWLLSRATGRLGYIQAVEL